MGEIPGSTAEQLRNQYVRAYADTRAKVRMNFEDMDFDNAVQRDEMKSLVEDIEELCRSCEAAANEPNLRRIWNRTNLHRHHKA